MLLTKTDFLLYHNCPSDFWFKYHQPEIRKEGVITEFSQLIIDQGYEVEQWAYKLFPDGVNVRAPYSEAAKRTKALIDHGEQTLFQATFQHENLLARTDILQWNDMFQGWDIYEVKGTTSKDVPKKEHLIDATFQKIVLEESGYNIVNVYLLEVNSAYVRDGAIDVNQLIRQSEITTEILELEASVRADIESARAMLVSKKAPKACQCRYLSRKNHCASFNYLYPTVPPYGLYDVNRIGGSKKKLGQMVDEGVLTMQDIRPDHELSKIKMNQIESYVHDEVILDYNGISDELALLEYPLYFLDYETTNPAIPSFDGTCPYQQVPFQYSLHIQESPGAEYTHHEYLHLTSDNPMHVIADRLREDIGDTGSVVVWHMDFEAGRNRELAEANPHLRDFLIDLNDCMFDLEVLFKKQYYVHKDFRGSSSIKYVTPVLCPELSYDNLFIGNGGTATTMWPRMIFGDMPEVERQKIYDGLLEYCKLDTWAMVRILEEVRAKIGQ